MGESTLERERYNFFSDFIKNDFGKSLTIDEAIGKLCQYHDTKRENVLAAFVNLKNWKEKEGVIIFKEGKNNGNECIVMEGYDKDKKWRWRSLINSTSGQPEAFCS